IMASIQSPKISGRKEKEDRVAWKRGGVSSQIKHEYSGMLANKINHGSSGLKSRIFKVLVGPQGIAFTVHEAHLCQSPVLERMCHGDFIESKTLEINLPEDDPKVFDAVANYLYTGEMFQVEINNEPMEEGELRNGGTDFCDETAVECTELTKLLADTYLVAEKWQLTDLKILVVEKLASVTNVKRQPILFFNTAEKLYASIPDLDTAYRAFFRKTLSGLLNRTRPDELNDDVRNAFDDCVAGGGNLAIDTVRALCSTHIDQLSASASKGDARVAEQRKIGDARLAEQRKKTELAEGWYNRLKHFHGTNHVKCTSCGPIA
ncbi:MAG: hypothetical protein Q9174_006615, partial [Haloplaca sp. 1 TL-2023]